MENEKDLSKKLEESSPESENESTEPQNESNLESEIIDKVDEVTEEISLEKVVEEESIESVENEASEEPEASPVVEKVTATSEEPEKTESDDSEPIENLPSPEQEIAQTENEASAEEISPEKVVEEEPVESVEEDANETSEVSEASPAVEEVIADSEESGKTESAELESIETPSTPEQETAQTENETPTEEVAVTEEDSKEEVVEEDPEPDYATLGKEELVQIVEELASLEDIKKADNRLKVIAPFFNKLKSAERKEALEKFIKDGGEADDFEFTSDALVNRFDASYKLIKSKKSEFYKKQEAEKEANLAKATVVLEKLRKLVDNEETTASLDEIKAVREEWKAIGNVPGQHAKTLWANFHALMDLFYDNRSIYFELKELDRRKNLEKKIKLCERAEELSAVESIQEATKELNELHHDYKHIGPVPKNDQEALWQRFKAASDAVYARRKDFYEHLKEDHKENLELKLKLTDRVKEFSEFNSEKISDWNKKTKGLLELQKEWEAIGGVPRERAKEVNRNFWHLFKSFFHHKNDFFKKLDKERKGNLVLKQGLIERAVAMKESTDWAKSTQAFKDLQQEWKSIGPVPGNVSNKVYEEFKAACDHFFDQKRASGQEADKQYGENLKLKEALCDKILAIDASEESSADSLKAFIEEWSGIGFVPRNAIRTIQQKYETAIDQYMSSNTWLDENEKNKMMLQVKFGASKGDAHSRQKMNKKEYSLRNKIHSLENDISTWTNNLEFFSQSKTADKLREEFEVKINAAGTELKTLKDQLRLIRSM